jgi:universal stress protein E
LDEQILTQAKRVSELTSAELHAVFCFVPLVRAAVGLDAEKLPIDYVEERIESEQREALNTLLARVGLDAGVGDIQAGEPEKILPTLGADLLVVGAVARGRLGDLILGSTAERILDETQSDLLVVKPVGFHSHVSHHVTAEPVVNPVFYPF